MGDPPGLVAVSLNHFLVKRVRSHEIAVRLPLVDKDPEHPVGASHRHHGQQAGPYAMPALAD